MKLNDKMCDELIANSSLEIKQWLVCILSEYEIAQEKHGNFPKDYIHSAAIVAEEAGELIRAALRYKYEKGRYYEMHKEAIQTAAMALKFLVSAPEKRLPT